MPKLSPDNQNFLKPPTMKFSRESSMQFSHNLFIQPRCLLLLCSAATIHAVMDYSKVAACTPNLQTTPWCALACFGAHRSEIALLSCAMTTFPKTNLLLLMCVATPQQSQSLLRIHGVSLSVLTFPDRPN